MKEAKEVFEDAKAQMETWGKANCPGNSYNGKLTTGFGGPYKTNESITQDEYNKLTVLWTALQVSHARLYKRMVTGSPTPQIVLLNFRCAASMSLRDQNGWDLLAEVSDNKSGFVYHILVV